MRAVLDDGLIYEILSVVEEIPEGRVATYGQIARLIGRERNARLVGKVLSTVWSTMRGGWFPAGGSSPVCWSGRAFLSKTAIMLI